MMALWRRGPLRAGPPPAAGWVVKVGGSLLGLRGWPDLLAGLMTELRAEHPATLLVVGGGGVADGLRAIDEVSPRPPALMHDLAIDAMSLTARIVADALALPVVTEAGGGGVLDAASWLEATGRGPRLPAGWHVTSDSIAALVAAETSRGLLLAKRVPPPAGGHDLPWLTSAGWIDPYFPEAATGVTAIDWVAPA